MHYALHCLQTFAEHLPQTGRLQTLHTVVVLLRLHDWLHLTVVSWLVVEDDEVDAGVGLFADDVASVSSADSWRKNFRRDMREPCVFLNIIHALMPAMSRMLQKMASGHRRQPAFVDICLHIESSMSAPHTRMMGFENCHIKLTLAF